MDEDEGEGDGDLPAVTESHHEGTRSMADALVRPRTG